MNRQFPNIPGFPSEFGFNQPPSGPGGGFNPPPFGPGGGFSPGQPPFGPGGGGQPPFGPPGQGGGGQAPTSPPPQFVPQQQSSPQLKAVDPGSIAGCLYRYTYVWMRGRHSFWFYPTFVGRRSVSGYRWTGWNWIYTGFDLRRVTSFQCF